MDHFSKNSLVLFYLLYFIILTLLCKAKENMSTIFKRLNSWKYVWHMYYQFQENSRVYLQFSWGGGLNFNFKFYIKIYHPSNKYWIAGNVFYYEGG